MSKEWINGTLVKHYSTNDNRVFKVVKEIPIIGYKYKEWYLVELIRGDKNQQTQYRMILRKNKLQKIKQKDFDSLNILPEELNQEFKELEGEFPRGSLIKGVDRSGPRSIYGVEAYYPIPDLGINGLLVKHLEFRGRKGNDKMPHFIHLDKFALYTPTKEEMDIIND